MTATTSRGRGLLHSEEYAALQTAAEKAVAAGEERAKQDACER